MDESFSVTLAFSSNHKPALLFRGCTCAGTQSPWPGYPVSSFQSPTRMAAWMEASHKDAAVWCFGRGPG